MPLPRQLTLSLESDPVSGGSWSQINAKKQIPVCLLWVSVYFSRSGDNTEARKLQLGHVVPSSMKAQMSFFTVKEGSNEHR